MSTDVFSIHCDSLAGAKLVGFKGIEALSRPFEFDVFFTVPSGTDVKGAVGARATLVADRGPMTWHGVLAAIRLLHETAERALYRASLVPRLRLLSHHVRSHVHTRKKIDAFAADTMKDAGLATSDYSFRTGAGAYPQEELVCQYRESHLDFIHRWFEREGLYYYFEHPEDGTERMVIVDDKLRQGPVHRLPRARPHRRRRHLGLRAGYTFQVDDVPADLPAKYLAIEVRHAAAVAAGAPLVRRYTGLDQAETYRVDVVAIPSTVQFRAPSPPPGPASTASKTAPSTAPRRASTRRSTIKAATSSVSSSTPATSPTAPPPPTSA